MSKGHYVLPDGNVQIAFSGGRTSAYMLHQILEANGDLPERVVVSFQNTGREMPETLDFVQECGERWGVRIVWLEYRNEEPRYDVVSHNSASRNGEPFDAIIKRRGFLPDRVNRFCSIEMKVHTVRRYLVDIGWKEWVSAVGIRADEPKRYKTDLVKLKGTRTIPWQPLYNAGVDKEMVSNFWSKQKFDLNLKSFNGKTPLGNCDGCFLKSEKTLARIARDNPEILDWWNEKEKEYKGKTKKQTGAMFNENFTISELRTQVEKQPEFAFTDDCDYFCDTEHGECTGCA